MQNKLFEFLRVFEKNFDQKTEKELVFSQKIKISQNSFFI
jgi:hypothetical protein